MAMKKKKIIIIVGFACLAFGFISGIYVGKKSGVPFITRAYKWSIGIYSGKSPVSLSPAEGTVNPVLTARNIKDITAIYVADPFMVKEGSTWYMFFEVVEFNKKSYKGVIGLAVSNDALHWTYKQVVLREPFHLSYPYVFKWNDDYYMIPESGKANSVRLYKAVDFPTKWQFSKTFLQGEVFLDSSILYYGGKWWLFTANPTNAILKLYYSDKLEGPWIKHPKSPIINGDANIARPGGRVLLYEGRIIRYAQDDDPTYGNQVRAFEITELTTTSYEEKEVPESPILKPSGSGWNEAAMHHVDAYQIGKDRWVACVDGKGKFWDIER